MPDGRRTMIEPGQERMVEALLYVAHEGSRDPMLGKTKIYKMLVIADILAKASLGETITRWKYMRFKNGPVPYLAQKYLESSPDVKIVKVPLTNRHHPLNRVVPLREADKSMFSPEELNLLDMALGLACQGNADNISDLSHGLPAWRWTEADKMIEEKLLGYPYVIKPAPATGPDLEFAKKSLQEQGLV